MAYVAIYNFKCGMKPLLKTLKFSHFTFLPRLRRAPYWPTHTVGETLWRFDDASAIYAVTDGQTPGGGKREGRLERAKQGPRTKKKAAEIKLGKRNPIWDRPADTENNGKIPPLPSRTRIPDTCVRDKNVFALWQSGWSLCHPVSAVSTLPRPFTFMSLSFQKF